MASAFAAAGPVRSGDRGLASAAAGGAAGPRIFAGMPCWRFLARWSGFEKVVDAVVGQERLAKLDVIIAGDDVSNKKPHPEIYNVAAERLGLPNDRCVVVEDSLVGLRAAKAAGMKCVITYTDQTADQDFYGEGADAKLLDFGDGVGIDAIFTEGPPPSIRPTLLEDQCDPRANAAGVFEYKAAQPVF